MNLLEAKEILKKKGYTVRRLNECGSSSCGGGGGCSGFSSFRTSCGSSMDYGSSGCGSSFSRRVNGCSGYSEPSSVSSVRTTQTPRRDATIQDLLNKIPPEKKALVIQLLKVLLAGN